MCVCVYIFGVVYVYACACARGVATYMRVRDVVCVYACAFACACAWYSVRIYAESARMEFCGVCVWCVHLSVVSCTYIP